MADPTTAEARALAQAKRSSVAHRLFKAARMLNERALARVRDRIGFDVRPAHTALFPHIDLAGTRLTELARRMGISKQAVGQLVGELEEMGALERVPDPEDGRAKLVRFARRRGALSLMAGFEVLQELEAELRASLGSELVDRLHEGLSALLEQLGDPDA
jgi:DNA-binding MarR family transcriptional regulator